MSFSSRSRVQKLEKLTSAHIGSRVRLTLVTTSSYLQVVRRLWTPVISSLRAEPGRSPQRFMQAFEKHPPTSSSYTSERIGQNQMFEKLNEESRLIITQAASMARQQACEEIQLSHLVAATIEVAVESIPGRALTAYGVIQSGRVLELSRDQNKAPATGQRKWSKEVEAVLTAAAGSVSGPNMIYPETLFRAVNTFAEFFEELFHHVAAPGVQPSYGEYLRTFNLLSGDLNKSYGEKASDAPEDSPDEASDLDIEDDTEDRWYFLEGQDIYGRIVFQNFAASDPSKALFGFMAQGSNWSRVNVYTDANDKFAGQKPLAGFALSPEKEEPDQDQVAYDNTFVVRVVDG